MPRMPKMPKIKKTGSFPLFQYSHFLIPQSEIYNPQCKYLKSKRIVVSAYCVVVHIYLSFLYNGPIITIIQARLSQLILSMRLKDWEGGLNFLFHHFLPVNLFLLHQKIPQEEYLFVVANPQSSAAAAQADYGESSSRR